MNERLPVGNCRVLQVVPVKADQHEIAVSVAGQPHGDGSPALQQVLEHMPRGGVGLMKTNDWAIKQ